MRRDVAWGKSIGMKFFGVHAVGDPETDSPTDDGNIDPQDPRLDEARRICRK